MLSRFSKQRADDRFRTPLEAALPSMLTPFRDYFPLILP